MKSTFRLGEKLEAADEAPPSASGGYRARRPRVLVVDEDATTARQLAIALELEGVEAVTAPDADEALAHAAEGPSLIDLVVIELMLPRRNGLELARELRLRFPEIRIVLTGTYHLSERQLARADCGAIAFVPKPCQAGVVAAFVRQKVTGRGESIPPTSGTEPMLEPRARAERGSGLEQELERQKKGA